MSTTTLFKYRAMDQAGTERRGEINAPSAQEAYRRLAASGLTPFRVDAPPTARRAARARVKRADVAHFTYQLSVLLGARIPIVDSLRNIAELETHAGFRAVILDMADRVSTGTPMSDAMEPHRGLFGGVYVETIRAAEKSGSMIQALGYLSEMIEEEDEMRHLVKGAVMYPLMVLIALGLACTFLVAFVVPRFAAMFEARGVDLPLLTRVLAAVGQSVKAYWWAYGGGIAGAVLALRSWTATESGRERLDGVLHAIPYLQRMLVALAVGRFTKVLGVCIASGLGLIDSLEMSGNASGRALLRRDAKRLADQVRRGGRLGQTLRECSYFPGFVKQLLCAGEESAELTAMCRVISRHYAREVRVLAKNLATVLEPVLIALLTGAVLVVALAIFMPMWDMVTLVG